MRLIAKKAGAQASTPPRPCLQVAPSPASGARILTVVAVVVDIRPAGRHHVEHRPGELGVNRLQRLNRMLDLVHARRVRSHHDQRGIGDLGQHRRVGEGQHGRRIDDQHPPFAQLGHHPGHRAGTEQLARVWRRGATGEDIEHAVFPRLQRLLQRHLADQHLAEADPSLDAEILAQLGMAKVRVDHGHRLACLGQRDREVAGGRRLALRRQRARHHDRAWRMLNTEELEVRAQLSKSLRAG